MAVVNNTNCALAHVLKLEHEDTLKLMMYVAGFVRPPEQVKKKKKKPEFTSPYDTRRPAPLSPYEATESQADEWMEQQMGGIE